MSTAVDAIDAATEQLVLVEGVLLEARDMHQRILSALQALYNARGEIEAARREVEGAK
jgi:hypothetical protein